MCSQHILWAQILALRVFGAPSRIRTLQVQYTFSVFSGFAEKTIKGFRILTNVLPAHSLGANTRFASVWCAQQDSNFTSSVHLFCFFRLRRKNYQRFSNPDECAPSTFSGRKYSLCECLVRPAGFELYKFSTPFLFFQ